jgi:hypothetical protein
MNTLQAVQIYADSGLGCLQNQGPFLEIANTKFDNFQNMGGQLGTTVTFDLPVRFVDQGTLSVVTFEDVSQRKQSLTVGSQYSIPYAFTAEELVFNIDNNDYRDKLVNSSINELGTSVESTIAAVIPPNTYRYYGDPSILNPTGQLISTFGSLINAGAYFKNFGSAKFSYKAVLDDLFAAQIVNSGLSQFVPKRNDELSNSWELGTYGGFEFYSSNLLTTQFAGTIGQDNGTPAGVLTLVSVDPTGTILTFSSSDLSDANAIAANDIIYFLDNIPTFTNLRYLTFTGHKVSSNHVSVVSIAQVGSDGAGTIVATVFPALIFDNTNTNPAANLNTPLVAGMQAQVLNSHRCGLMMSGDPLYVAMPPLPNKDPYPSHVAKDPDTGISLLAAYGNIFPTNQYGFTVQAQSGQTLVPDYSMRLVFPM